MNYILKLKILPTCSLQIGMTKNTLKTLMMSNLRYLKVQTFSIMIIQQGGGSFVPWVWKTHLLVYWFCICRAMNQSQLKFLTQMLKRLVSWGRKTTNASKDILNFLVHRVDASCILNMSHCCIFLFIFSCFLIWLLNKEMNVGFFKRKILCIFSSFN